jgi:hypothetical protein
MSVGHLIWLSCIRLTFALHLDGLRGLQLMCGKLLLPARSLSSKSFELKSATSSFLCATHTARGSAFNFASSAVSIMRWFISLRRFLLELSEERWYHTINCVHPPILNREYNQPIQWVSWVFHSLNREYITAKSAWVIEASNRLSTLQFVKLKLLLILSDLFYYTYLKLSSPICIYGSV